MMYSGKPMKSAAAKLANGKKKKVERRAGKTVKLINKAMEVKSEKKAKRLMSRAERLQK